MDLIQQFKNYLFSQKNKPSSITVKNYLADIRHFITWYEMANSHVFAPKEIGLDTIEAFRNDAIQKLSASSVDRHISSLKKFFTFLKLEGNIPSSPFEDLKSNIQNPVDPWHLKEFKDFLYVYNASRLTIKNYLIDLKQFLRWIAENNLSQITPGVVEQYKNELFSAQALSATSVNRKLSSLRKYLSWAQDKGIVISEKALAGSLNGNSKNVSTAIPEPPKDYNNLSQTTSTEGKGFTNQEAGIRIQEAMTEGDEGVMGAGIRSSASSEQMRAMPSERDSEQQDPEARYSKFPPLRLLQKISKAFNSAVDAVIVLPLVKAIETSQELLWKMDKHEIFTEEVKLPSKIKPIKYITGFKNIAKVVYNPTGISLTHLPAHQKIWHHLRYTRPNWYKRYHSYSISHYFHVAILVIFMSAIGFGMYQSFFGNSQKNPAFASLPAIPSRTLSFQGRLTDSSDNPITTATNLRFAIYNNSTSTGSGVLLWQEVDQVTPDTDGDFSTILGNNTSIPSTLFSQNVGLWLGVTVEATAELTPRQPIATVAFASNSETLQGLPPITATSAGTTNVVLALDSSGNLTIGGTATPSFTASGGQFTLSGKTLSLTTVAGSNTNIQLAPDGSGIIDLQKPLQNTTLNSNIPTAAGSVEVDDLFSILATSSGQSALTINQTGSGPLISASSSGTPEFTVDNSGNTKIAGNLTLSGNVSSNLTASTGDTYNLGTSVSNEWNNLYVKNIYTSGQLFAQYWQLNSGVLSPSSITNDLILGATSTSSASPIPAFGFLNVASGVPTATIAANLSLKVPTGASPSNSINLLNGGTLGVYTATTGKFDAGLNSNPTLYIGNNSRVGIGNNSPATALDVNGTVQASTQILSAAGSSGTPSFAFTGNANTGIFSPLSNVLGISTNGNEQARIDALGKVAIGNVLEGNGQLVINQTNNSGLGDIIAASAAATPEFRVSNGGTLYGRSFYDLDNTSYFLDPAAAGTSLATAGNIGVNTTSTLATLDIRATSGITAVASASGKTAFAALIANNDGLGDLFTASSSSNPEFTIQNNGTIVSTHYKTAGGVFYTTSGGVFSQASNASANTVLHGGSTPTFSAVDLANDTTGVLGVSNGGLGANLSASAAIGDILYADSTTTFKRLADVSSGQCLVSGGVGAAPGWATCPGGSSGGGYWTLSSPTSGAIVPINNTLDVLIGANSTSSAKFGFLNVNNGTPTASISAGSNNPAISIDANGTIQTYKATTLTLGGTQTGNITIGTDSTDRSITIGNTTNVNALTLTAGTGSINFYSTSNNITSNGNLTIAGGITAVNSGNTINGLVINSGALSAITGYTQSSGNFAISGTGTFSTGTGNVTINGPLNADLIPSGNGSINLGSSTHYYKTVYADSFSSPAGNGTAGFWTVSNNTNLYPTNPADDLLIGGTATNSAAFQVFAQTVTGNPAIAGTATTSGYLTFNQANGTNPQINILNGNNLIIKTSAGGDTGLNTQLTVGNNGDLTTAGSNFITSSTSYNLLNTAATSINFGGAVTGSLNIGGSSSQININGQLYSNLLPRNTTINLGSTANVYGTLYASNIKLPVAGGTGGYWTLGTNILYPTNNWNDLAVGGTATASATPFQVFANSYANGSSLNSGNVAAGTATTSGNLTFRGASSQIDLVNGAQLGFYTTTSGKGDAGLNTTPLLYLANTNNIGIQTTSPTAPLDVNGNASVSGTLTFHTGSSTIQTTSNGILTFGGNTTGALAFGSNIGTNFIPTAADTYNLGSASNEWNNLYVRQIISPVGGGTAGYWQLNSNVLSPANNWNDLAVGGTATGSATPFQVFANSYVNNLGTVPAGTATTSGNLTFRATNSKINILNGGGLGFYGSVGGDNGISSNPALYIDADSGNIAMGTTQGLGSGTNFKLFVQDNNGIADSRARFVNATAFSTSNTESIDLAVESSTQARTAALIQSSLTTTTDASRVGLLSLIVDSNGTLPTASSGLSIAGNNGSIANSVGIGTTSPLAMSGLDIERNGLGNSVLDVNQLGAGDILTASASGTTKLVLKNNGYLALGPNMVTAQGILDVASGGPTFPSDLTLNQASGTNLVTNPSFEGSSGSSTGWVLSTNQSVSSDRALFGSHSLKFSGTNAAEGSSGNCITVSNGTSYTASEYIYRVSGFSGNTGMFVNYYSDNSCVTSNGSTSQVNTTATNTWTRLSISFTGTTGSIQSVRIRFITNNNATGTAYADGFQVEQASSATPYLDGSLGPGYGWTGTPNNSSSVRYSNSSFTFDTINSANGIGAAGQGAASVLQLDQNGTGPIITASQSGTLQFQVTNGGTVYARSFYDLDSTSYFLDPAAGTTSLNIAGDASMSANLTFYGQGATHNIYAFNNGALDFQTSVGGSASTIHALYIAAGGNVGIGTTNPSAFLDVAGNASASGDLAFYNSSNGVTHNLYLFNNSNLDIQTSVGGAASTNHALYIAAGGKVGVGTTSPAGTETDSIFTVQGGAGNTNITSTIINTGTGQTGLVIRRTGGSSIRWSNYINSSTSTSLYWFSNANDMSLDINGNLRTLGTQTPSVAPDIAENIDATDLTIGAGDIVNSDPDQKEHIVKADSMHNSNLLGVISTKPAILLHGNDNNLNDISLSDPSVRPLVLGGRVPTKVWSKNGVITSGDRITSSSLAGFGVKATKAGYVAATALETFNPNDTICSNVNSIDNINWPADDWDNTQKPCFKLPDGSYVGKIMAFVNVAWYDPDVYLTTTGDVQLSDASVSTDFTIPHYYTVNDALGNPISRVEELAQLVVGNLRAGSVQAQQVLTNSLAVSTDSVSIAGQSLHDYIASVVTQVLNNTTIQQYNNNVVSPIAEVNQLHANLISPLASDSAIALSFENSRIDVKNNASGSAVASIDNQGNATFSGTLNSQNLAVNGDATVSGTLHANRIEANDIAGLQAVVGTLSAQNITNVTNIYFAASNAASLNGNSATGSGSTSSTTSGLLGIGTSNQAVATSSGSPSGFGLMADSFVNVASFSSYLAYVPNLHATTALFDQGLVSLGPTSLSDTSITGTLSIGSNLELADTSINVLGADFQIQPLRQGGVNFLAGQITIDSSGNLTVNGKAVFNNTLAAHIISPIANDQDLTLKLGDNNNATIGALASSNLSVQNASGSGIFTIDQLGNVIASGAASIGKLNLNLVQPVLAVSDTEVMATGSAGTANIQPHQSEVTIDNKLVTDKSLIYITPVGGVSGVETPYLLRQVAGTSFTVGIQTPGVSSTTFNWLIVN